MNCITTYESFVSILYTGWVSYVNYWYSLDSVTCQNVRQFIFSTSHLVREQYCTYLSSAVSLGYSLWNTVGINVSTIAAITGMSSKKVKNCIDESDVFDTKAYQLLAARFGNTPEYWYGLDTIVRNNSWIIHMED